MANNKWIKGMTSPNPGGRPSAVPEIAKKIAAETRNGDELLEILLCAARGKHEKLDDAKSIRWAIATLLDRFLGKAAQTIAIGIGDAAPRVDYSALSDEDLAELERITAKLAAPASARATGEGAGDGGGSIH